MTVSPDEVRAYWEKGYINAITVLSEAEAQAALEELEQIEARENERAGGRWWPRDFRPWESTEHPLKEWGLRLALNPKLLDAVETILGPNILIRNIDVFTKNRGEKKGISWHVDTAERGEHADKLVTAWIGLTDSTSANGCLEFAEGSHVMELPDGPKDKFTLTLTRRASRALLRTETALNEMPKGQASFHHFRTAHRSGPNRTRHRRVGFVVRYMASDIATETAESGVALLARGKLLNPKFTIRDFAPMSWSG